MISLDGLSLDIAYTFLILVPGFITFQAALYHGKLQLDIGRFQQISWSLICSGLSLSILYFVYTLLYNVWNIWGNSFELSLLSLPEVSSAAILAGYPIILLTSYGIGFVIGHIIDNRLRKETNDDRRPAWRIAKSEAKEPTNVRIETNTGYEILGQIYAAGSSHERHDLLIAHPYRISRKNGSEIDRHKMGSYAFVKEEDIAHIYFETDLEVSF